MQPSPPAVEGANSPILRLRGLPFQASPEDVQTFFAGYPCSLVHICKRRGETLKHRFCHCHCLPTLAPALHCLVNCNPVWMSHSPWLSRLQARSRVSRRWVCCRACHGRGVCGVRFGERGAARQAAAQSSEDRLPLHRVRCPCISTCRLQSARCCHSISFASIGDQALLLPVASMALSCEPAYTLASQLALPRPDS